MYVELRRPYESGKLLVSTIADDGLRKVGYCEIVNLEHVAKSVCSFYSKLRILSSNLKCFCPR